MIDTEDRGYSGNARKGDLYDRDRYVSAAEIAKSIRAQIKDAVKAGDLPGKDRIKFSVRSQTYAGGQSVHINIIGTGPEGPTEWAYRDVDPSRQEDAAYAHHGMTRRINEEATAIAEKVKGFGKRHTREDVDAMVDHFDVSCYVFAYLGHSGLVI